MAMKTSSCGCSTNSNPNSNSGLLAGSRNNRKWLTLPKGGRRPWKMLVLKIAGTSSLLLSGGLISWQLYNLRTLSTGNIETFIEDPEFIEVPEFNYDEAKAEIKLLIPKQLRKSWKLLRQASKHPEHHHLAAVKELSKLRNLTNGEFCQLAQSLDRATAIGLARYENSDLRFFLRPPPLPGEYSKTSIPKLFHRILSELPQDDSIHSCIRQFTTNALETYVPHADDEIIRDSDLSHEFHRDSHHIYAIPRQRYSEEILAEYCLQALLSHSTLKHHCHLLISNGILVLFQKIIKEIPDSPKLKSLIGKIIANLSLYPETHDVLFRSGWIRILAEWKRDPNLLVTLPATKALCNLDQKYVGHIYPPGVYLLNQSTTRTCSSSSKKTGIDVIFLHGLLGGVFYSWRQGDPLNLKGWGRTELISTPEYSFCWPRDWLSQDTSHIRVLGIDFDTYLSQWGGPCPKESFKAKLEDRSQEILAKLKDCGVGKRPIIFAAHSMGGLIVKKMLTMASASSDELDRDLVNNTKGIVFYGTPHSGSQVAKLNATSRFLLFPSTEVQELEPDSPMLNQLHHNFLEILEHRKGKKKKDRIKIISFGESIPTPFLGLDFTFVPEDSSNPGVGDFYKVNANHMNVCKPDNRHSILYRKFLGMIWDAIDE